MPILLLLLGNALHRYSCQLCCRGHRGKGTFCFWSKCEKICMERVSALIVSKAEEFHGFDRLDT